MACRPLLPTGAQKRRAIRAPFVNFFEFGKEAATSMWLSIARVSSPSCSWSERLEGSQRRPSWKVDRGGPYKIDTVLTDNGIEFTSRRATRDGPTASYMTHMFDMRCRENGIEHRLTKMKHPWTNGQVERMNRTIKEATSTVPLRPTRSARSPPRRLHHAYNYARRLKTLKGLTPYEYICKCWTSQPERFKLNPLQQMPGLNT